MAKQGTMDKFIKKKRNMNDDENSDSSQSFASEVINIEPPATMKRIRTSFTRNYDASYIEFGFVAMADGAVPKPQCVICGDLKGSALISKVVRNRFLMCHIISTSALRASYKVALRIAKKPFTTAETLVNGCLRDVCSEMFGDAAAKKVAQISPTNDTITRRNRDIANDLLVYVRYQYEADLKEEFLFAESLTNTTSYEISKALNDYIVGKCGLD